MFKTVCVHGVLAPACGVLLTVLSGNGFGLCGPCSWDRVVFTYCLSPMMHIFPC